MTQNEFIKLTEDKKVIDAIAAVFNKLVPGTGKADTVAGEIIRALNTVFYMFKNKGATPYEGEGLKTVAPSMHYLFDTVYDIIYDNGDDYEEEYFDISADIEDIILSLQWFNENTKEDMERYEAFLEELGTALISMLSDEVNSHLFSERNTLDSRYVNPSYFEPCFEVAEQKKANSLKEDFDDFDSDEYECCLCHKKMKGFGNDPYPLVKDPNALCCDECNSEKVIPARLSSLRINEDLEEETSSPKNQFNYDPTRDEDAITRYKRLAHVEDDFEITADNINPKALQKCSCYCNYDIDDLKEMLIESCKKGE